MGYNTPILVLNDTADLLRSDANAGPKILDAILESHRTKTQSVTLTNGRLIASPVIVLEPKHADATRLLVVGQNSIEELAELWYCGSKPEDVLKALADKLGYRVVKKNHAKTKE